MSNVAFKHSIKVPRLYKSAAKIFKEVSNGGNFKTLIYEVDHPNKKGIKALVIKTLQHNKIIDELFKNTKILQRENNLDQSLAAVLTTELLWGKRLLEGESKPIQTIINYQEKFLASLDNTEFSTESLLETVWRPRYIRINTLRKSPETVIEYFLKRAWNKLETPDNYESFLECIKENLKESYFAQDYHFKDVLLFPFGTVFARNPWYKKGFFVLQDKASCMASHVLAPQPGSTVLDMCAAPGMKTVHLATYMENKGKIYAVDQDKIRFKTLKETISRCGAKCVTPIRRDVFKIRDINPTRVDYILVDPSCSGSGMLSRSDYEKSEPDKNRLNKLSKFQKKMLRYALTNFPSVKRVVYSTCSIHAAENEEVVEEVFSNVANNYDLIDCPNIFKQWSSVGLPQYSCGNKCIRSVSDYDCLNGFFIAAFERKKDEENDFLLQV